MNISGKNVNLRLLFKISFVFTCADICNSFSYSRYTSDRSSLSFVFFSIRRAMCRCSFVLIVITMLSFIFYKYFTDFHRRLRFGTTSLVVPLCFFHVFTLHRCVTCHFINFTFHRFHLLGFYMNLRTYENASIYTCVLFSDVSCDNTYW